jgi:hypothetical protein
MRRDARAEFVWLLAMTRARKIREQRPASDGEVAALLELYRIAMTTEARAVLPQWQALEVELRAEPDPLATSSLPSDEYEALQRALAVYDEHARTPALRPDPRRSRSGRGRRLGDVSEDEANKAARIYRANRKLYDNRPDEGAYAVHALYSDEAEPPFLSRAMVGHLVAAIKDGKLGWDADEGRGSLKIPSDFRTRRGMFVIPRRETAS